MSPRLRFKQVDFSLIERRRETLAVRVSQLCSLRHSLGLKLPFATETLINLSAKLARLR
jgi:hypothetical protein